MPIEAAIPGARGHVLEGAAHVVAGKEMRARFSDLIADFLATVETQEGASL